MTRIVVIGDDCARTAKEQAEVTRALEELGLGDVIVVGQFRAVAQAMTLTMPDLACCVIDARVRPAPAPQFGSARPYLKKTKGRS